LNWELFISLGRTVDERRLIIIVVADVTQTAEHERHLKAGVQRLEKKLPREPQT
jgi:hypothetical protein